jgi:hypothetical protein
MKSKPSSKTADLEESKLAKIAAKAEEEARDKVNASVVKQHATIARAAALRGNTEVGFPVKLLQPADVQALEAVAAAEKAQLVTEADGSYTVVAKLPADWARSGGSG